MLVKLNVNDTPCKLLSSRSLKVIEFSTPHPRVPNPSSTLSQVIASNRVEINPRIYRSAPSDQPLCIPTNSKSQSQLTPRPPDTTVSPGLWLNVELSLGILSASLPSMRPLCSRAIPSQIRSQVRSLFSHSRHSGTHRLEDAEGVNGGTISGSRAPHSKALSDSGIYQGQNKQQPHKSWYNAGAHVSSKKTGRHSEDGSEEDMVPMGRIHVKHDLEWEQERGPRSASQSGGTTDTLR